MEKARRHDRESHDVARAVDQAALVTALVPGRRSLANDVGVAELGTADLATAVERATRAAEILRTLLHHDNATAAIAAAPVAREIADQLREYIASLPEKLRARWHGQLVAALETVSKELDRCPRISRRAIDAARHGDWTRWDAEKDGRKQSSASPADAAARGVAGPSVSFPFLSQIQRSFGAHDISGIRAHVGGDATVAALALGARAYTHRDAVAFASAPDLHTAAHEAAHVIQQRGGVALANGIDSGHDEYEQHADRVADAVVRGDSVEGLLDRVASRTSSASTRSLVQRKKSNAPASSSISGAFAPEATQVATPSALTAVDAAGPALRSEPGSKWSVFAQSGRPYIVESRGGHPGFWVARDWIASADDMKQAGGAMLAPSRARELLAAVGWVLSANMEFAARSLTFRFLGGTSYFSIGAAAAVSTGLPAGVDAIAERGLANGLSITVALDQMLLTPGAEHDLSTAEAERVIAAATAITHLPLDPDGHATILSMTIGSRWHIGNGVVHVPLTQRGCRTLFGPAAYDEWLGNEEKKKQPDGTTGPKLAINNFYQSKIPGDFAASANVIEAKEVVRFALDVTWPHWYPNEEIYAAPPMVQVVDERAVPIVSCWWMVRRLDKAGNAVGRIEMKQTSLGELDYRFDLAPGEAEARFEVTCFARCDAYFEETTFQHTFPVLSTPAAMEKLQAHASKGLTETTVDRRGSKWMSDLDKAFVPTPAGALADDARSNDRAFEIARLTKLAEYLHAQPEGAEAEAATEREIDHLTTAEKLLATDGATGRQGFELRGTYLSRTEGLASGALDLHATVYIEAHLEGHRTRDQSMAAPTRSDRVVVRIRDFSRRFDDRDSEFVGTGKTFDAALHEAFDDLALAYPKGVVSIEAEQIRERALRTADGALGPDAALGPSTGNVIGFQRTTDSTWKSIKNVILRPAVSIAANLAAGALMAFLPATIPIVAPLLAVYNSTAVVDHIDTEVDRGTLTEGAFVMSVGEIALNVLPFVGEAKPFTMGWYAVETINWGGQVALMSGNAVAAAREIQATRSIALGTQYDAYLQLEKTLPASDPSLQIAKYELTAKVGEFDGEIRRQFSDQVKGAWVMAAAGSLVHHGATELRERLAKGPSASGHGAAPTPASPAATQDELTEHISSESDVPASTKSSEPPKQPPVSSHDGGGGDGSRPPRPSQIGSYSEATAEEQALVNGVIADRAELARGHAGAHPVIADEFHTEQQADQARWQTHGLQENPSGRKLLADKTFRHWYEQWIALPDNVTVNADGTLHVKLPHEVPHEIGKQLLQVVEKGNIGLMARADAIRHKIAVALPGTRIDPTAADWPATRRALVEIVGEGAVAKFEGEKAERMDARAPERAVVDHLLMAEAGRAAIDSLREMYPGTEIYVTGSAAQPEKAQKALNSRARGTSDGTDALPDLDLILVVPDTTPSTIRIEIEHRLSRLLVERVRAAGGENASADKRLPVDAKVMTQSEFVGLSMMSTADRRTPLSNARIDAWSGGAVPGTATTGADLHNHGMGVPGVEYYIAEIGRGSAVDVLEKAWTIVQENPPDIQPTTKQAIVNGIADVRNAEHAGLARKVLEARARNALDQALAAHPHEMPFDHTYDLRDYFAQHYIDPVSPSNPRGEFQNFAKGMIETLAEQGTTYSEQSVSTSKLKKRFTENAMANAHERARLQGKDCDVKFLAMLSTEATLSAAHGATELSSAIVNDLEALFKRSDVKGVDFAGPEKHRFTSDGMAQFEKVYALVEKAAKARGERLVLRPHVGEGYDPHGGGGHVEIARQNLELLLTTLEQLGYEPNGWVIVRFGHATHASDVQLGRIARLGVIIEANVGSNLATGSIVDVEEHPIVRAAYFDAPTVLATDGQGVMHTTLPDEYRRAAELFGLLRTGAVTLKIGERIKTWLHLSEVEQRRFSLDWLIKNLQDYASRACSTPSSATKDQH